MARDFPGSPVAKTLHSWRRGLSSIPGRGTRSHMPWPRLGAFFFCNFIDLFWLCWVFVADGLFSSCGEQEPLPPCRLLVVVASPVIEHRLWGMGVSVVAAHVLSSCISQALEHRLSSCGARAYLLLGVWDLLRQGIKPVSTELAGGFFNYWATREAPVHLLRFENIYLRTSLVVQGLGLPLPMQGVRVWSLAEGCPHSSVGKDSACNAGDPGSIPGSGRSAGKGLAYPLQYSWASLVAQLVKNPPAVQETWVQSLGWEDPLEKGKATHSNILA